MYYVWTYGYDGRQRGDRGVALGSRVLHTYASAIGRSIERVERVWQNGKRGVALTFRNGPVIFIRHA